MFYTSAAQRYCPNGIVTASIVLMLSLTVEVLYATQNWPSFRGLAATGIAEGYPTATEWDLKSGEHIRWKTPIPGLAHSSPVIWGDQIFVTTAVKSEGESRLKVGLYGDIKSEAEDVIFDWRLCCIDRKTGKIKWTRLCHSGKPKVKRHAKSTHANATACTNGKVVVTFFGAEGLYCYDLEGNLVRNTLLSYEELSRRSCRNQEMRRYCILRMRTSMLLRSLNNSTSLFGSVCP